MNIRHSAPVLAAFVLSGVAACGGGGPAQQSPFGGGGEARTTPVQQGVVTAAEAKTILDRYEKAADHARVQGSGWEAAEAGLSLQQTKADNRVNTMIGERQTKPMDIRKARFSLPRGGAWFLAEFTQKGSKSWTQLIFQKTAQGWRAVAGSVTDAKTRLPAIAKDRDGLATALPVDARGALTVSPRDAAQTHARLIATVGDDPRARRTLAPGAYTTDLANHFRDSRKAMRGQWNARFQPKPTPEIFALKSSAGGALIWYGQLLEERYVARPGIATTASMSGRQRAALSHGKSFKSKFSVNTTSTYLAVIPPSPGKVRVIASWASLMSITGS
jgi:hypothetical protein